MLLQRPTPYEDESLESFVIRVANKNGYDDVHRFLMAIKSFLLDIDYDGFQSFPTEIGRINPCSSKNNSRSRTEALQKLSQMTFNEPAELMQLAVNRSSVKYSPGTSALIRGAEIFPRSLLRSTSVPICPLCLQEKGYASYLWQLEGYTVCHEHKVALVAKCLCGAPYDYLISGLKGTCADCGQPILSEKDNVESNAKLVSSWLKGVPSLPLPDLPQSYRWGLVHWWKQVSSTEFNALKFVDFWNTWPGSIHKTTNQTIDFNLDDFFIFTLVYR